MEKPKTIPEAIALLGTTEESVSNKLREMGIKGKREEVCNCPIANYLKVLGFNKAIVYQFRIDTPGNGQVETFYNPENIKAWIQAFDRLGGEFEK